MCVEKDEIFIPENAKKNNPKRHRRTDKNKSQTQLHETKSTNGNTGRQNYSLQKQILGN